MEETYIPKLKEKIRIEYSDKHNKILAKQQQKLLEETEQKFEEEKKKIYAQMQKQQRATVKIQLEKELKKKLSLKEEEIKNKLKTEQQITMNTEISQREKQLQLNVIQFSRIQTEEQLKRVKEEASIKEKEIEFQQERDQVIRKIYDEAVQLAQQRAIFEKEQLEFTKDDMCSNNIFDWNHIKADSIHNVDNSFHLIDDKSNVDIVDFIQVQIQR